MDSLSENFHVPIRSDADIVVARQKGRALAIQLGFNGSAPTVIAAAISEVARNIVIHAYFNVDLTIVWRTVQEDLPRLKQQIDQLLSQHPPVPPPDQQPEPDR